MKKKLLRKIDIYCERYKRDIALVFFFMKKLEFVFFLNIKFAKIHDVVFYFRPSVASIFRFMTLNLYKWKKL